MTFGEFLGGHLKKRESHVCLVQGGVAFMGALLSGENGQAVNFR